MVVPCYNGERFIAQTLESILSQTHENIECHRRGRSVPRTPPRPLCRQGVPERACPLHNRQENSVDVSRGAEIWGSRKRADVSWRSSIRTAGLLTRRLPRVTASASWTPTRRSPGLLWGCHFDRRGRVTSLARREYKGAQDVEDVLLFRPIYDYVSLQLCQSGPAFSNSGTQSLQHAERTMVTQDLGIARQRIVVSAGQGFLRSALDRSLRPLP